MAITSTITDRLPSSQKPTPAHTPNAVTELAGEKGVASFSTTISATGNVDADEETAYTNIETATKTVVDAWLVSVIKLDAAASITAVIYITSLEVEQGDKWADDGKDFIVKGRAEWQ